MWKRSTPSGVAYLQHLYTRILEGEAADDVEEWLDREYENPAAPVIERILKQQRLSPDDWPALIRYVACQDVRTPARLLESLKRQEETMQHVMQGALEKVKEKLHQKGGLSIINPATTFPGSELLPLNVSIRDEPESDSFKVEARTTTGRSNWLFSIKYLLQDSRSIRALLGHKWTILRAPKGFSWCTSDNPVIRLNYHSREYYDFKGGWGSEGTQIIFPLAPSSILYTRIGDRPPLKGTVVSVDFARSVQRLILENAHRHIFCQSKCTAAPQVRPRTEDISLFMSEQAQWRHWHERNMKAELELLS